MSMRSLSGCWCTEPVWRSMSSCLERQTHSPGERKWWCRHMFPLRPLGTNFINIWIKVSWFYFNKMHMKISSEKMAVILFRAQCFKATTIRLSFDVSPDMMTSSNGNVFRVTGSLCGEFAGYRWILRTIASDAELWCFLWSAPEETAKQTIETVVIWDAISLIMTSL